MPKEYISREELYKQILSAYITAERGGFDLGKDVVLLAIEQQSAADVVEVVRCGECANWQSGWKPSDAKDGAHYCANVGLCMPSDWYCADGERKDRGQDDV